VEVNEFEELLEKGVKYVEHVREYTSKQKINNPGFVSLLAAITFADTHDIDFNTLVNKLYATAKYRTVDKFRNDFLEYKRYRDLHEAILEEPEDYFIN